MHAPYDPRAIANLLLEEAVSCRVAVSPLVLQKLLYFAHGAYMARTGDPLVAGYFEAWENGPVHPQLYHDFKRYGRSPIITRAERTDLVTGEVIPIDCPDDIVAEETIREVLWQFRRTNAYQLIALSHAKGAPWDVVVTEFKKVPGRGLRIDNETIRKHFFKHKVSAHQSSHNDGEHEDTPLK